MKQKYLLALFALTVGFSGTAQTYSAWGLSDFGHAYDTIHNYDDTMYFSFSGIPTGGWGNAKFVVYREGDFGDNGEYLDIWENLTNDFIGSVGSTGTDCSPEDSVPLTTSITQLYIWENAGNMVIKVRASDDVDMFCDNNRVKVRLEFGYCTFGTPVQLADLDFSDDFVCAQGGSITLSGTPLGGAFSGPGVTGNTLDPSAYLPGLNYVSYTATDILGCTTTATEGITILGTPTPISELICEGSMPEINTSMDFGFFSDAAMTNELDYTSSFTVPAVVASPTYYYYAAYLDADEIFTLDAATGANVTIIDHDAQTGDDRGGVAFSTTAVYVVGDDYTARYDLALAGPATQLPTRDGLVTDLSTGTIYSLYNITNTEMPSDVNYFEVEALIELDSDLNPTANIITLSSTVIMGNNMAQNGIFSGYDHFILASGENQEVFSIDFSGQVTSLGVHSLQLFGSENWADWGVAGFDGSAYVVYYRWWNDANIVKHELVGDVLTPVTSFSDMTDMASFIYHPGLNRLYFHYEGGGQFGGSSETFGFMDASHTIAPFTPAYGCPAIIEYTFNSVYLGPDTTVCREDGYILEPGLGYGSYTWNGDNNNWNVFPVSEPGTYTVEVEDGIGCILEDEVVVSMEWCSLGSEELSELGVTLYPAPNNGIFALSFDSNVSGLTLEIIDLQGKVVYSESENGTVSAINVDASLLGSGVYVVVLNSDQGTKRVPMVVSK